MEPDDHANGEATPRRAERRPSLSFHGIAKSPDTPTTSGKPSGAFPSSLRHLDRRLSVEFSAAHPQVQRKTSLGVPSPNQLSRRNSLEVPHASPKENPAGAPSTPMASPRSPLAGGGNMLQRRLSLEVPFDRRLSEERRPSAEDFLARRISIDESAASLTSSPVRRLSSSSFTGADSADQDDRMWAVPFSRRDSRGSIVSEVDGGGGTAGSNVRLSPGRGSPSAGLGMGLNKRPASVAFDYAAFEPAGPELKRPRSPSAPRVPSPLHAGASQSPYTGQADPSSQGSDWQMGASRSPRNSMEKVDTASTLLAAPGSAFELGAFIPASPVANASSETLVSRDSIRSDSESTLIGPVQNAALATVAPAEEVRDGRGGERLSPAASEDSLMAYAMNSGHRTSDAGKEKKEKIQVVAYDEESGATVTLDHETDTAEIQLECPPVRASPARK